MESKSNPKVIIIGGGLGGLAMALALQSRLGIIATVYEQAPGYADNVGGAIGLYPNGLRVLRDINPTMMRRILDITIPFQKRRWMRHDGTEIAVADEHNLCHFESEEEEVQLGSKGVRRWRLQKALYEACLEVGVVVVFNERLAKLEHSASSVSCTFASGLHVRADLLFGCDGVKSAVRASLFGEGVEWVPKYTGVTCLMGAAPLARPKSGICFPSSRTSHCHAVFYPTGENEQVFQLYFAELHERPETWRPLSEGEGKQECTDLANRLLSEGWAEEFVQPLFNATAVIRAGLRARDPLKKWTSGRVALMGDAAHPPVPYIGQGAMMAFEDVGILSLLMREFCLQPDGKVDLTNIPGVFEIYEEMRVPRTTLIYQSSKSLGAMQTLRAVEPSSWQRTKEEWCIWYQVRRHGTLPVLWRGSGYHYQQAVLDELKRRFPAKYKSTKTLSRL